MKSKSELLSPDQPNLHQLAADEGELLTIHFDVRPQPIRVHTLSFGPKGLPGLELSYINIELSPTIPEELFEVCAKQ